MSKMRPYRIEELDTVYSEMNMKWIDHPEKWTYNSDLLQNDKRSCLAIYSYDSWKLQPLTWQRLQSWLQPLLKDGIGYTVEPSSTQGRLHFTFHQLSAFSDIPPTVNLTAEVKKHLQLYLEQLSGIEIHFRGLITTPTGIALRGFPADSIQLGALMNARNQLHDTLNQCGIEYSPPYINDICHATLFRWTSTPSQESIHHIQSTISHWSESHIATFVPKHWWIGNGTYRMTDPFVKNIHCFHTPMFIAHRGLTSGPSSRNENNKETLLSRAKMGLYSECDIWYIDGKFFLGHDTPSESISTEELCTPYLWLHAKNKEAYEQLLHIRNSYGINLRVFWHTTEDYVLTTHNDCIVFPGKPLLQNSVFMMPENAGEISTPEISSAICSDYTIP